jgi:hypothetical protein
MTTVVSYTLYQTPPPKVVVQTKDPVQTLTGAVSVPTPWPVGTGLARF